MSRPSSKDEKASTVAEKPPAPKKHGFFSKKVADAPANGKDDERSSTSSVHEGMTVIKEAEVPPVGFLSMFRFSTKFEIFINIIGLVCAAAAGAAQPVMTILFGRLTQDFVNFTTVLQIPSRSGELPAAAAAFRSAANKNALYLVLIGIAMFVCTYIYMYVWVYTAEANAKRIREHYLKAVLRQDIAFFDNVGAGEVATRIQTDTHLVQQGISEKVALSVMFLAAFVAGFIIAYIRSWRLALPLTSILPCIAITATLMNKAVSKYMQLSLKHVANGGSVAEEVIATIRTAQAFGSQKTLSSMYDHHIFASRDVDSKAAVWHGAGLGCFFFVIYAAYGLAFNYGTTLILRGHANVGDVVNVFMAIMIGSFSLALLAPEMQAVQHGRGAAAKLFAVIDRVPPIDSGNPGGLKPEHIKGEITLTGINFFYPSRPTVQVVKDLSLHFPAGKTAALVGASGSGKSTVVSLVERFYDPATGKVEIDGVDVREWNVKYLRSQIGLVSQEPTLFATTIWGNVAHGLINTPHEHASHEEKTRLIKEACVKANADGFIAKLPMGYDTMVGERGFLLSGGQKQRVAIARAIVSDPKILLLDEATSALDTQSEGVVQDALDKASAGRTTITIAHRLSTIKDADQIFVMGEGRVLEQGTHNELLASADGAYSRLVSAQKLREIKEREAAEGGDPDDDDLKNAEDEKAEIARALREEVPLGRRSTATSLASEVLKRRMNERSDLEKADSDEYSMYYLFKRMGKLNREVWRNYAIGAVFACITGMVFPAYGVVYAQAIQGFATPDRHALRRSGDRVALWFFLIAIIATIAIALQNWLFASAAATLTCKLRSLSFKAIVRQDIEFFDRDENSSGSLTANLSDNPQKVNGLAGITLGAIVQSVACLVSGCILGLIFIWKLALVGIACIPFVTSAGYIRLRVVVLKDQANKKAHESSAQLACEAAAAIRTVASLTREDDCCDLYSQSLEEPLRQSNKTAFWSNALYALSQSMTFFVIALVFWYGSRLISFREFSTMDFFIGLMSTTFGAIQAGNVFSFVPDISSAKGAATDILRLVDSVPEIDAESTEGKKVDQEKVTGQIRLENIHFRYPTRPAVRVLRDLSIRVEPGTYIALVGASGCGKSTVIQLIERFYDPLAGTVYLDGQNITEYNIQEYRKQIALVSQEPTLYSGTVKFNILLGAIKPHSEVTQEEIEEACRNANILEFIQSLPQGFDTEVGGKGSQLSGGQKQRIAIARALLRNPKVLLLDEATSALDSTSEKVVQQALDQAAKGRTTIAIAHRLSTIQNADRIYFIKEGAVSESGTHDQLLSRKGDYYEYVQLQALSKKDP